MLEGEAAVAVYRLDRGAAALVAFPVGGELAAGFATDPEQGASDYLAGATGDDSPETFDAGPLGGGLACTDDVEIPDAIACACADARTTGQLTFRVPGLAIEDAVPVGAPLP